MNDLMNTSNKLDISGLYKCLYAFLLANIVLCIALFLFGVKSAVLGIIVDLLFMIIVAISHKFHIRWILWIIFIINLFNLSNILTIITYAIPLYVLSVGIYRNLKQDYRYLISEKFENRLNQVCISTFSVLSFISYLVLFIMYSYFECQIIKNAFWQFLNPLSYLWALWEMFKNPFTYHILYITAIIFILTYVFTLFGEYDKERNFTE